MAIHTDAEKEVRKGSFGYSDIYLYKFMFSYMSKYKKELTITGMLIVLYSIFTVAAPLILDNGVNLFTGDNSIVSLSIFGIPFIDNFFISIISFTHNIFPNSDLFIIDLFAISIIYLVIQGLTFFSAYYQNAIIGVVGLKATKKIREDAFEHLQELDMSYHDKNEVGRIMSRLTGDVEAIQQFFGGSIVENVMNLFTVLTLAVVIVFVDPYLAFISYSLIPLVLILSMLQKKYNRPLHKESRRTNSILMAYLGESIERVKNDLLS